MSLEGDGSCHAIRRSTTTHFEYEFPAARHVEHESLHLVAPAFRRFHRCPVIHPMAMFRHVGMYPQGFGSWLRPLGAYHEIHREMLPNGDFVQSRLVSQYIAFGFEFLRAGNVVASVSGDRPGHGDRDQYCALFRHTSALDRTHK